MFLTCHANRKKGQPFQFLLNIKTIRLSHCISIGMLLMSVHAILQSMYYSFALIDTG